MATTCDKPDRCCECDCPAFPKGTPVWWDITISGVSECEEKPWLPCETINGNFTLGPICPDDQECTWLWFGPRGPENEFDLQFYVSGGLDGNGDFFIGFAVHLFGDYWVCMWGKAIPGYVKETITLTSANLRDEYPSYPWCNWRDATISLTPGWPDPTIDE